MMIRILLIGLCLLAGQPALAQTRGASRVVGKEKMLSGFYDKTWAVIIGIDDYSELPYNEQLQQAVRDAKGVEKLLQDQFRFDRIITLYDAEATRAGIMKVLLGDLSKTGKNDGVLVFFAGHGNTISTEDGDLGYLLPHDGSFKESEQYKNISMTTLKNDVAKAVPAKHIFFVMDACYSGLLLTQRGPGDNDPKAERLEYLREITRERVRQVLAAGGKGQTVLDGGRNGHSVFTGRFLQALEDADGYITGKEIGSWVPKKVFYDAKDRDHKQQPQFGRLLGQGDFVFVKRDIPEPDTDAVGPVPPPPPPPVAVGHLQVNVNAPGSKVYINGSPRGDVEPGVPLNLQNLGSGEVEVRVEAEGYQSVTKQFTLTPNKWTQAVLTLEPVPAPQPPAPDLPAPSPPMPDASDFGSLRLTSEPPDARLYLDGKEVGRTPYTKNGIKGGKYRARLVLDWYRPWEETVKVRGGKTFEKTVTLKPTFGSLTVESDPAGGTVYIDGKEAGLTPLTVPRLSEGKYKIRVEKGEKSYEKEVRIKAGETVELKCQLRKKKKWKGSRPPVF